MSGTIVNNELIGGHYGDTMRSIIYWLRDNPGEHSVSEVIEGLGISECVARAYLGRMVHSGWACRPRRGIYAAHNVDLPFYTPNRPGWAQP